MRDKEPAFACDMTAIALEHRGAHLVTIEKLFQSLKAIRELSNGYAFELPNESDLLRLAAEFVTLERLCCPFFGFSIEIEREGGAVCLSLTGREGVKPFIMAEIGKHLPVSVSDSN
jgi:hypothetical protein